MVEGMLKEVLRRRRLDGAIDRIRLAIDTFPQTGPLSKLSYVSYQPLPWLGLTKGKRVAGSVSRWQAIASVLDELDGVETAADLGANVGYFTINVAERGIASIAVESNPVAYRTALYAIEKAGVGNAAVLTLELSSETLKLLPEVDVMVFLSLWHHLTRAEGLEVATELLRGIWARTRRVLFFDTGENEMPPEFRLPRMEPDGKTWLADFLARKCEGGEVRHLGLHDAFDAEGRPARRNLFAVVRS